MINKRDIVEAGSLLNYPIVHTPLVHSQTFSRLCNAQVYLKLENMQKTGSFKIRGASYKIHKHRGQIGPKGVVAASAGNHAQGVALAAHEVGLPATIVMPEWASISKQEATLAYGGDLVIYGKSIGESLEKAQAIAATGKLFMHPFDDDDVIVGQGTVALEILTALNTVDVIVVPIGGGGLISGIAIYAKSINPRIRIIGVQSVACPSASEALKTQRLTKVTADSSIADGISVRQIGARNFDIIKKYVDEVVLVEEEHIAAALLLLLERKKILVEGAGAITLAALMKKSFTLPSTSKVVLVISGGNVDSALLGRIIKKGMIKSGRIMMFFVQLKDLPGSLAHLLYLVAELKANVLDIIHDRNIKTLPVDMTRVGLELETRGPRHIKEIAATLADSGYVIHYRG